MRYERERDLKHAFRTRHLCYSHAVYLQAIGFALQSKVGSRGSSIALDSSGEKIHGKLDETWKIQAENTSFRTKVLETEVRTDGVIVNEWIDCRPVPEIDSWFETTWADFRSGLIFKAE